MSAVLSDNSSGISVVWSPSCGSRLVSMVCSMDNHACYHRLHFCDAVFQSWCWRLQIFAQEIVSDTVYVFVSYTMCAYTHVCILYVMIYCTRSCMTSYKFCINFNDSTNICFCFVFVLFSLFIYCCCSFKCKFWLPCFPLLFSSCPWAYTIPAAGVNRIKHQWKNVTYRVSEWWSSHTTLNRVFSSCYRVFCCKARQNKVRQIFLNWRRKQFFFLMDFVLILQDGEREPLLWRSLIYLLLFFLFFLYLLIFINVPLSFGSTFICCICLYIHDK